MFADRIIVLGTNPGHIKAEIPISLERPRDRRAPEFEAMLDRIYGIMTGRDAEEEATPAAAAPADGGRCAPGDAAARQRRRHRGTGRDPARCRWQRRPRRPRRRSLARGRRPAAARRRLPAARLRHHPRRRAAAYRRRPRVRRRGHPDVQAALRSRRDRARAARAHDPPRAGARRRRRAQAAFFLDVLRRHYSAEEARAQLDTAIDWGRYGELYEYDADTAEITRNLDGRRRRTDTA